MAKGNDGNLLQHTIEVETASWLTKDKQKLHVVITHGMAPFEEFEPRKNPSYIKLLDEWLEKSQDPKTTAQPKILNAYRSTNATQTHYPNSAEVLAAAVGERDHLTGVICEKDDRTHSQLSAAWPGSDLQVLKGSWRTHLTKLYPPRDLMLPWLITMDPYAFTNSNGKDDGWVRENDFAFLAPMFHAYFDGPQEGAVTFFSYSTQPGPKKHLLETIDAYLLARNTDLRVEYLETGGKTGVQIAAVITKDQQLLDHISNIWRMVQERNWSQC